MSRIVTGALVVGFLGVMSRAARAGADEDFVRPSPGFRSRDAFGFPASALIGGVAYSPAGHPITYDNESGEIRLRAPDSTPVLARFEPPVFGSFLVPLPDGTGVIFSESTAGNVYSVPYTGEGARLVDNIPLAFDLAFGPEGRGFASALESPFNRIVLLDGDPAAADKVIVANIAGYSGPLAFDAADNLYYGTADFAAESQKLIRFPAARVRAAMEGEPIDYASADFEILADEIGGFFNLKWDRGKFFFSDLGFATGEGAVYLIDPDAGFLVTPLAVFAHPDGILSPAYIAVRPGAVPFAPGAGPAGGGLLVSYSNFTSVNSIAEIEPEVWFVRGRINADDLVDLSDAVALLDHLFRGGEPPEPLEAGNVNDDAAIDISDPIFLLEFLFRGGRPIPPPYPDAGADPE